MKLLHCICWKFCLTNSFQVASFLYARQDILCLCGTWRFIAVFTRVWHLALLWATLILLYIYTISLGSILLLSSHLHSGSWSCLFPAKAYYVTSFWCNFIHPCPNSCALDLNILLSTLFSVIISLCSQGKKSFIMEWKFVTGCKHSLN